MTAQLSPTPIFKGWANDGTPLAYGLLYSYAAGTTTPQATYVDSTQGTPNTNPVVLNARGECALWLDPTLSYKFNLTDVLGNQIPGYPVDNINGALNPDSSIIPSVNNTYTLGSPSFSWANLYLGPNGAPAYNSTSNIVGYYGITPAEIAAAVTPTNYAFPPGNILRYGTNTTPGTTDMSAALANALAANLNVYIPSSAGTYYCAQTSAFTLTSNQTVYGDGQGSLIQFAFGAGNNLQGNGITKCTVRDLFLQVVSISGVNTYIGALAFINNSTYCKAVRVSVAGVWGCGIYIGASSNCLVQNCSFVNFQGTNNDQADVYIGQVVGAVGSNYNIVDGCECFGGGWHGVIIQSQNGGVAPNLYNIVTKCRIGQHVAYGIANYSGAATVDNFNQIIDNYIENIQGTALSGQAGAGIYSVSAGGDIISGNTIRNCCVQTTSQSLAPGAIGIAQVNVAGLTPVTVSGNNISGMTNYFGIYVTLCTVGVALTGNTILHPVANTTGSAIGLQSCSNVSITGGSINSLSTQAAIISNALANVSNITINGVSIQHAGVGLQFYTSGSFTQSQVSISGNQLSSSAASSSINASFLSGASINANTCVTGTASATSWSNCLRTRLSGNTFVCTGTYALVTGGTCTDSLCDESNYLATGGNTGLNTVSNGGTGFNLRQLGTVAASAAGTTQILGDTVINTAGVTPFAWVCTTAGTPGTFTGLTLP